MNVRLFVVFTVVLLLAVNTALVLGIPCSSDATRGFIPGWDWCPTPSNIDCDLDKSIWKKETVWLIESYPTYDKKNKAPYGSSYYRISSKGESYRNPHLPSRVVRSFRAEMIEESGAVCGGMIYTPASGYFREDRPYSNDDDFVIMRGPDPSTCYMFRKCDWERGGTVYGWRKEIANKGQSNEYERFVWGSEIDWTCKSDNHYGRKYEFYIVFCDDEDDL